MTTMVEGAASRPIKAELKDRLLVALTAIAAGAIAGFVVGGVGGWIAMFVLRLTSPDSVIGLTSDDGFEIGRISLQTFNLFLGTLAMGGFAGVVYLAARPILGPTAIRPVVWMVFSGVLGAAVFVQKDGVDFTLLEPRVLAIAFFLAIPALGGLAAAWLVEQWIREDGKPPHIGVRAAAAAPAVLFIAPAIGGLLVALGGAGLARLHPLARRGAGVLGAAVLAGMSVLSVSDLVRDLDSLLF